jgi:alpha-glucosidase
MMRSHEGNRPDENLQLDQDANVLAHFVRMTRVHAALAPYVSELCDEAVKSGLPLQRAMFLDYEADRACWEIETQYCYGCELVVAPVLEADAREWEAYLPQGTDWVHVWSGKTYGGGWVRVDAPLGEPPVFYRADSRHAGLFAGLARL